MTGFARLILAGLLALALAPGARADDPLKAKVGVLRLSSSAPVFIAQEKGYFREAGLDIELKFFDAAQPIAVAVTSGDIDFGVTAFTAGLYNLAGKGTLKVIGGMSREKAGYPLIGYFASNNAWAAGLSTPVHSFGPVGLEAMTRAYWELNKFDVETRIEDEGRPDPRPLLIARDIPGDGVVLQTADVKVTAFRTPHPPITDNFAYKFETPDGTIVFSSDTAYNPKLAEFAKGADVLVHECLYVPAVDRLVLKTKNGATLKKHLMESHTTTEDVGRIAAAAGVKVLALSHFVPGDDPQVTDDDWTEGVKKHYSGRIIVAKDLMQLALPV